MNDDRHHLIALREVNLERLRALELQSATLGISTPPEIAIEINGLRTLIATIDTHLGFVVATHILQDAVPDFVGRELELDKAIQSLSHNQDKHQSVAILGIQGMGGIGKTQFALAVAQRLRNDFPDRHIFIDLRGVSIEPLTPTQAMQMVIRSFDRERILPDDLNTLRNYYYNSLLGRRILIVADDARDAKQVKWLIPPTGCALIITSRQRFALPGMIMISLNELSNREATQLLLEICPRIGDGASQLAELCSNLPLALRLSANFLASNDSRSVARYLEQMKTARLLFLRDPDTDDSQEGSIEKSIQLSYNLLDSKEQKSFCRLGVFPSRFDLTAASAVIDPAENTEVFLDLLRRRNLIEWDSKNERFYLHDLIRDFVYTRIDDPKQAKLRLAKHYLLVMERANDLYIQGGIALLVGLEIFDQERLNIDTSWRWLLSLTPSTETDTLLINYTRLTGYIGNIRYNIKKERIPLLEAAIAASRRISQIDNLPPFYLRLGFANNRLQRYRQAAEYCSYAVLFARKTNNRKYEGMALNLLGAVTTNMGEHQKALKYCEEALLIAQDIHNLQGEGEALGNIGFIYVSQEKLQEGINYYIKRLKIAREIGDTRGEGLMLNGIADIYLKLGKLQEAVQYFDMSIAIIRRIGDKFLLSDALWKSGLALEQQEMLHSAIQRFREASEINHEIENPDTEKCDLYLKNALAKLADQNRYKLND